MNKTGAVIPGKSCKLVGLSKDRIFYTTKTEQTVITMKKTFCFRKYLGQTVVNMQKMQTGRTGREINEELYYEAELEFKGSGKLIRSRIRGIC